MGVKYNVIKPTVKNVDYTYGRGTSEKWLLENIRVMILVAYELTVGHCVQEG